jgi:hypothetical protein
MGKFLKSFLHFFFFASSFYLVVLFFWGNFAHQRLKPNLNFNIGAYGHSFSRFIEARKTKDVDIMVVGSSHAYRGFDPRIFEKSNLSLFNLGSSSQTPFQTDVLLKRHLENIGPKVLVYEVYPGTFCADGIESSLDIISNDRNDWYSFNMVLELNHIKTYNTFLYAGMRDLLNFNSDFSETKIIGKDTYIDEYYKPTFNKKKQWNFKPDQFSVFREIVQFVKSKNIRLVLVYAPITSSLYNSYINNDSFDSIMKSFGPEYYNFNQLLNLEDSIYFYDSHHLNQFGVDAFNQELIDLLYQSN